MRKMEAYGPYEKVKAGDVYVFRTYVITRGEHIFKAGERLRVIEPTGQTPYGEIGPDGVNWHCQGSNGYTVWATLEHCIARGLLERVDHEQV